MSGASRFLRTFAVPNASYDKVIVNSDLKDPGCCKRLIVQVTLNIIVKPKCNRVLRLSYSCIDLVCISGTYASEKLKNSLGLAPSNGASTTVSMTLSLPENRFLPDPKSLWLVKAGGGRGPMWLSTEVKIGITNGGLLLDSSKF